MTTRPIIAAAVLLAAAMATGTRADETAHAHVHLLGEGGQSGGLTAPALAGVATDIRHADDAATGGVATRLTFRKDGGERRIVALQGKLSQPVGDAKAIIVNCRLNLTAGERPQMAIVAFQRDGDVWYRPMGTPPPSDVFGDVRLPLKRAFTRAQFASGDGQQLDWNQVDRVWIALLIDGPASGAFDVRRAIFTAAPFQPTSALALSGPWTATQDPAVSGQITVLKEGPEAADCSKYVFQQPGGRHMYALPRLPVHVEELDGYSALRFTCKADLPRGIDGLLVMLIEADGTQYRAEPAPQPDGQWQTFDVPFDRFARGGWSTDENDRLDLNDVRYVVIGVHGTAEEAKASGTIWIADVEFLP